MALVHLDHLAFIEIASLCVCSDEVGLYSCFLSLLSPLPGQHVASVPPFISHILTMAVEQRSPWQGMNPRRNQGWGVNACTWAAPCMALLPLSYTLPLLPLALSLGRQQTEKKDGKRNQSRS